MECSVKETADRWDKDRQELTLLLKIAYNAQLNFICVIIVKSSIKLHSLSHFNLTASVCNCVVEPANSAEYLAYSDKGTNPS